MILIGAKSIIGRRERQQDSYCFSQVSDSFVAVVADGNGGVGGELLSEIAAKASLAEVCFALSKPENLNVSCEEQLKKVGLKALNKASEEVNRVKKENGWQEQGTTLTLIIVTPELSGCFYIGDSPAFLIKKEEVFPLIIPHTLAEKLIREEGHSREQISQQPTINSILTQCLGHEASNPGIAIQKHDGKCIVLVGSDGLFDCLPEEEVEKLSEERLLELPQVVESLVQKSFDSESQDNITAVLTVYKNTNNKEERLEEEV